MAGYKDAVLLAAFLLLAGNTAALDFNVNVAPTPEASVYQPNASTQDYFRASVAVKNPGSIGCRFRIQGDIQQGEQELTRYSSAYNMWPGELTEAEFLYLPINYTGQVEANLSLNYCGESTHIDTFTFNYSDRVIPNTTIESKTLEVNSSAALVSLGVEDALLIPQQHPPLWKVGSQKVNGSRAVMQYEPTLFKKGEEIQYTVLKNGSVKGKTTVVLRDQEAWYEELFRGIASIL